MKKIISAFAVICCISVFLTGCGETLGEGISAKNICGEGMMVNDSANDAFNLYLENDALQLFINPDTVELKLVRKSDGFVWTSFVPGGDESQRSLIEITYLESSGSIGTMNSFNNAVIDGQYKIETDINTVKIGFSMGGFSEQVLVPELLTPERYKEVCDNLDDDFDLMKFQNYYYYFDCKDSNNENENSYLQKYPALKEKSMYIVNDSVLTSSTVKKEFAAILQQSGYTSEMYYEDKENFDEKVSDQNEPGFNITLELSLKENSLVARIPNNSVEMYSEFPLITVSVLKYFGCSTENNGYFLLPDGSGSVMNFYNGKTDGHPYTVKVYGNGYSLSENEKTSDYANASLPVFGISKYIEDGLSETVFENNSRVLVNFNTYDVSVQGLQIKAKSYRVEG